jgi:AcrR family transcriptional regulator
MSNNERAKSKEDAGQKTERRPRKPDARIRRTHERLGRALVELIREKPIDNVTVQEILDRAAVGLSTFYLHFRDKNDLLLSQLEKFLETMSTVLEIRNEQSRRVVPVEEMFAHIGSQKKIYRALADSGRLQDFFDLARATLRAALSGASGNQDGAQICAVRNWAPAPVRWQRVCWHF